MNEKPSIVALIPARAGSKRIPGKNIKPLGGKPLIWWTIQAAIDSGIFTEIHVSTDSRETLGLVQHLFPYRTSSHLRSEGLSNDDSPDILWIQEALAPFISLTVPSFDAFAILRPTSPFRTADTIRRGWQQFQLQQPCHSIRAVQPVKEHPDKMWEVDPYHGRMHPITALNISADIRWRLGELRCSRPTQTLKPFFVQNASLEIAWTWVPEKTGTISGSDIYPFYTEGLEGFDINTPEDWTEAEYHMAERHHPIEYLG